MFDVFKPTLMIHYIWFTLQILNHKKVKMDLSLIRMCEYHVFLIYIGKYNYLVGWT
jgi:hypothetical protein